MDTNDVFHDSAVLSPSVLQCDMFCNFRPFFVILMLSRHPDHRYLYIYLHPLLSLAGRSYGLQPCPAPNFSRDDVLSTPHDNHDEHDIPNWYLTPWDTSRLQGRSL